MLVLTLPVRRCSLTGLTVAIKFALSSIVTGLLFAFRTRLTSKLNMTLMPNFTSTATLLSVFFQRIKNYRHVTFRFDKLAKILELVFTEKSGERMKKDYLERQGYPTDLTDEQWATIEPLFVGMREYKHSFYRRARKKALMREKNERSKTPNYHR